MTATIEGPNLAACLPEAPAGSRQAKRERQRPPLAWKPTIGRAPEHSANPESGLRVDTLDSVSIVTDRSSVMNFTPNGKATFPILGKGEKHQDKDGQGGCDKMQESDKGGHDQILEEAEIDEPEIRKEETVHMVCMQMARSISEVLGAELRGDLQAALREEVSRSVREEFQRCSQQLRETLPQRTLVENGCQADCTTVPTQCRAGHTQSDGNTPCASLPSQQKSMSTFRKASHGQKPRLLSPGDEARHHISCGDSFAPGMSSGPQSFPSDESIIPIRQNSLESEARELLQQQGLVKYVPKCSNSNPKPRTHWTEPLPWRNSRSKYLESSPAQACASEEGLSKKDYCELGGRERTWAGTLWELHPEEHDEMEVTGYSSRLVSSSHCSKNNKPTHLQEDGRTSQSEQDSRRSFSTEWNPPPLARELQGPSPPPSTDNLEEILKREVSIQVTECAMDAVDQASNIEGSLSQSSLKSKRSLSQSASKWVRHWFQLDRGARVPTMEDLRKRRDEELVQQLSSEWASEEPSKTPAASQEEARKLWFVAWAADIGSRFGTLVPAACAVVPLQRNYPCASRLYQLIIFSLVGKGVYHIVSMNNEEWEMGETSRAVVLALDSVMGMGALVGLLSCGVLWRSKAVVECCKLMMAYANRIGILPHWEEVSPMDFFCTVSLWLTSVVTATIESLYFEVFPNTEDLLAHIGCFALFSFVLMGTSQFALHTCRCLTKMIDTFCVQLIGQPDFSEALMEWSLLQALCRSVCSSIQFAFLSLQATATAVVLLSIQQVGRHDASRLMALAPGLVVAAGVFRTSMWAAAVTDKCMRVPSLVNSVSIGTVLDYDRMYTVQYIVHSQAGFYLFDLRLTSATVLKTAYVASAITFYLASKVFVE